MSGDPPLKSELPLRYDMLSRTLPSLVAFNGIKDFTDAPAVCAEPAIIAVRVWGSGDAFAGVRQSEVLKTLCHCLARFFLGVTKGEITVWPFVSWE